MRTPTRDRSTTGLLFIHTRHTLANSNTDDLNLLQAPDSFQSHSTKKTRSDRLALHAAALGCRTFFMPPMPKPAPNLNTYRLHPGISMPSNHSRQKDTVGHYTRTVLLILETSHDMTPAGCHRQPFQSRTPAPHKIHREEAFQSRMCTIGVFQTDSARCEKGQGFESVNADHETGALRMSGTLKRQQ